MEGLFWDLVMGYTVFPRRMDIVAISAGIWKIEAYWSIIILKK
jgi:hypothetical protein